jgi:tetratricopeptide (TPR) repeat protein
VLPLAVAAAFAFGLAIRVRNYPDHALYQSDAAMRYRWAKMVAEGKTIPTVDRLIQAPEGLRVRALDLILEDVVAGTTYRIAVRLAPRLDFPVFLKWFVCVLSALMVPIVYLLSRAVWRRRSAGLASAAFYAAALPGFERVLGNYLREELVLPFIFLSLYCFLRAMEDRNGNPKSETRNPNPGFAFRVSRLGFPLARHAYAFGAGGFMFLALSSWHLSSFYLICFLLTAGLVLFRTDDLAPVMLPLRYLVAFTVLAGLLNEPLRGKGFLASPSVVFGGCLLVADAASRRFALNRKTAGGLLVALTGAALGLTALCSAGQGQFGHVYGLVLAKLRFLGVKPQNPARLAVDARLLWLGPFQSPSLADFLQNFAALSLVALVPFGLLIRRAWRRTATRAELVVLLFTAGFGVLYLLVRRLEVFFVVLIAVLLGGCLVLAAGRRRMVLLAVLAALLVFEVGKAATFPWVESRADALARALRGVHARAIEPPSLHDADPGRIFAWVSRVIPQDAIFLARFAVSPMIAAYAGRAAVLQPVFEDNWIREKVLECMSAYYAPESALYAVCRKYHASYVLYEANQLLDNGELGDRYIVNRPRLTTDCAAFRMHFQPESLHCFVPLFQTDYLRIFQVREQPGPPVPYWLRYSLQYDPVLFRVKEMSDTFSDSLVAVGWTEISGILALAGEGDRLAAAGESDEAAEAYASALDRAPEMEDTRMALGTLRWRTARLDLAIREYRRVLEQNRYNQDAYLALAGVYRQQQSLPMARDVLNEGLGALTGNPNLMNALAAVEVEAGDTAAAIAHYEALLRVIPGEEDVRRQLELLRSRRDSN